MLECKRRGVLVDALEKLAESELFPPISVPPDLPERFVVVHDFLGSSEARRLDSAFEALLLPLRESGGAAMRTPTELELSRFIEALRDRLLKALVGGVQGNQDAAVPIYDLVAVRRISERSHSTSMMRPPPPTPLLASASSTTAASPPPLQQQQQQQPLASSPVTINLTLPAPTTPATVVNLNQAAAAGSASLKEAQHGQLQVGEPTKFDLDVNGTPVHVNIPPTVVHVNPTFNVPQPSVQMPVEVKVSPTPLEVNVSPTPIEVKVSPTPVEVKLPQQPAPVVNVSTPPMPAPVINVLPSPVPIEVKIPEAPPPAAPPRQKTKLTELKIEFERDRRGEITGAVGKTEAKP